MNLLDYLCNHITWSLHAFGEGHKTKSITNHIRNEIVEIREKPRDLVEWIDVAILSFDGAWRAGYGPKDVATILDLWLACPRPYLSPDVILKQIEGTLALLESFPQSLFYWSSLTVSAFQGAFCQGHTVEQVMFALQHKQSVNFGRKWQIPENPDDPIEHVRNES